MRQQSPRLLIKRDPTTPAKTGLRAAGNTFREAEPVLADWQAAEASGTAAAPELWDAAYEAFSQGAGSFIEPDHEQVWNAPVRNRRGIFAGGPEAADRGVVNNQSDKFPKGEGFAWHLGEKYTQLEAARKALTHDNPVAGAILDVGFDLDHRSAPANLILPGRNFTGEGVADDVEDKDVKAAFENPGHGTATIAILAGRELQDMKDAGQNGRTYGGAPYAKVLPIRIAKSVVLLRTSAFAKALDFVTDRGDIDVVSMSMGGLASEAWAEAVNRAYESGIFVVTAAGNNYGRPKSTVFPARFNRVVAACGAMADFAPYVLPVGTMSGNYGPDSKMDTAIAAFTPNIPWAEINSGDIVDLDGEGTSSATPQVAAAALLWLTEHKHAFTAQWRGWEKVEAIRRALFDSADHTLPEGRKYFGRGILKAHAALAIRPGRKGLRKQDQDTASFGLFRLLRGSIFSIDKQAESPVERMFDLELAQLIHRDADVEATLGDPEAGPNEKELRNFMDAVIASPWTSRTLRAELERRSGKPGRHPRSASGGKQAYQPPTPPCRRLRVFAFDPAAGQSLDTAELNETTVEIPWEETTPGPRGEYVEVIDHDPASGCFYMPVHLHDPRMLATDGLAPAEGNPRFHQQMVYAVAMRTITTFEHALGRKALWSPRMKGFDDSEYVGRLRIYPHALLARNAYYNPMKKALLFGYFPAEPIQPGTLYPGGLVFTCLSHDVVAHETAHALLDGMNRGLVDRPTNPDILAFHEAFADIVALFLHFTLPGVLHKQLARVRGDLRARNMLGQLALEFGLGAKMHGALRSYIGKLNDKGEWEPAAPDPKAYEKATEQHDRGAVLVGAVFSAFIAVYDRRIADLKRIASDGTGILRQGDLHPDLVSRFADEARKSAAHVLRMCVRALDYCPPLDMTFGDYLRAMITADYDVYPVDDLHYRVAMIEAFRERGIYPHDVRAMSNDALRWQRADDVLNAESLRPAVTRLRAVGETIRRLSSEKASVNWPLEERGYYPKVPGVQVPEYNACDPGMCTGRKAIFHLLRAEREYLYYALVSIIEKLEAADRDRVAMALGVDLRHRVQFEVRSINFADRAGLGGIVRRAVIVQVRQRRGSHEGGCTLICDCDSAEVIYAVRKGIYAKDRRKKIADFQRLGSGMTYFGNSPLAGPAFRFGMLHTAEHDEDSYA